MNIKEILDLLVECDGEATVSCIMQKHYNHIKVLSSLELTVFHELYHLNLLRKQLSQSVC